MRASSAPLLNAPTRGSSPHSSSAFFVRRPPNPPRSTRKISSGAQTFPLLARDLQRLAHEKALLFALRVSISWLILNEENYIMMNRYVWGATPALILVVALVGVGCGEAERLYDCARICDGYSDCINDDIDKTDCTDRCEDQGEADPDFADQANDCEHCLNDKSCSEATVECSTKCAWVVAEST
jgi:hypothetical protein